MAARLVSQLPKKARIHAAQPRLTPQSRSAWMRSASSATAPSHAPCSSHPQRRRLLSTTARRRSPQTMTEKIVQRYAVGLPAGKLVRSGDYVSIAPEFCMTHDNTAAVINKFASIGATRIRNPGQLVFTVDHDVQNKTAANLAKYRRIHDFAAEHGVVAYPPGRGIGHQIMVEEGFAWPGTMVVASDSHSVHYGSQGALGTPIVRTDAMSIWATSRTWWQIPPVARVTFTGVLPPGVVGKDVIVALCSVFKTDVLNHAIEFAGSPESMASLPMDTRMTISNMACEWGALSAIFPIDDTLKRWLRYKATEQAMIHDETGKTPRITHERVEHLFANPVAADADALYAKQLYFNLSSLSPYVSGPDSVKIATPLNELARQNIKVNKAYIVSCTNSRASDLAAAAKVIKDAAKASPDGTAKIADGVKFYIAAASAPEQAAAEAAGDWQTLIDAGAKALPSGCSVCIGLGEGTLEDGEIGISASNRNFKGRMGSRTAQAYLASPEVVAASALRGKIWGPHTSEVGSSGEGSSLEYGYGTGAAPGTESALSSIVQQLDSLIERVEAAVPTEEETTTTTAEKETSSPKAGNKILPGFPEKISGEILFCDADNLDTDAIYPGRLTYQDNVSKEDMAAACMSNYDPTFAATARAGDVLVAGANFGCGSSREQAATALLARGIPLVVAGSFGNIFSRNSINNALMGLEVPRLVERLRAEFGAGGGAEKKGRPTRRTGWTLTWHVTESRIEVREGDGGESWSDKVGELPANVQEIIAAGGLEAWVKGEIGKS